MQPYALQVHSISKRYPIGGPQKAYGTLRDTLTEMAGAPKRLAKSILKRKPKNPDDNPNIWALKDISFEVEKGDVVGLIGRNGAGKSTLLKVLSRITEPTEGYADLYGRIGSLLEVGTGFHPELSGRENIYLNGAILGMKREEIRRQFDAIVEFAEVAKFVDTPVKHYSSGMYLRLAFAVAAHLQTEILLVDEVLAVGDLSFQRKCLGKMGDVANEGRTVLFVSHNMGAVRSLCKRGVVLDQGKVLEIGDVGSAIATYYKLSASTDIRGHEAVLSGKSAGFAPVTLSSHTGSTIQQEEAFEVSTILRVPPDAAGYTLLCLMEDMHQRSVYHLRVDSTDIQRDLQPGLQNVKIRIPPLWLEPGLYSVYFKVLFQGQSVKSKVVSDILHLDVGGTASGWGAVLSPKVDWTIKPSSADLGISA